MLADQTPWLLRLQSALLAALGIWLGVRAFGGDINSPGLLITLAMITLGFSALFFMAARLIPAGALWPQAPVVYLEISGAMSSLVMLKAGLVVVGVPVMLLCVATLVGVVSIRRQEHPED